MTMSARWMMIAILGWSGVALAEDLIVIDVSNAPGLAEGTVIADGKAVELPAGAKVTLIGASGKTIPLNGPYKGVPGAGTEKGDGRLMVALTSLVQSRSDNTSKVGALRTVKYWRSAKVETSSDVYMIDGSLSDAQCVSKANSKQLALVFDPAKKGDSVQMTLLAVESGTMESLVMTDGATGVSWPSNMAVEDGNSYLVEVQGRKEVNQFTVKVLDKPAANDVQRAAQLLEAGCTEQARLMIEVLKKSAKQS